MGMQGDSWKRPSRRVLFLTGQACLHHFIWLRNRTLQLLPTFLLFACPVGAPAFTALVGFGDSYTDTGNFPSSPPDYWNGRFSNGPLWSEDLSQMLGFTYNPANNYAVSGTESDELGVAIANFPGTTDSADVLFAIWSGNNDFANHLNLGTNDGAWDTRINSVVSSLMTASDLLYQKGARNLIVFNLMDPTRCPDILSAYSSSFRSYINGKVQIFNFRLAAAIPYLLSSHPGLQVYLLDTYSDFNYLLDNYASLGFTKATVGALNDPALADKSFSGPGANYVFWDSSHPTAKAHNMVAQWVGAILPPPPPPAIVITAPQNGGQFTAPATISVNTTVAPNGWTITQVAFFENGALLGQLNSPPYSLILNTATVGTYTLTAQATYGGGQTINSAPVEVRVLPPPGSSPPPPWKDADIGAIGLAGAAYYASNGTFTVEASGSDIWGASDAFHFVYQPFSGDGSIIACVNGLQNTDGFAKAGLMFRETLDSGACNAMAFITPTSGAGLQDRVITNGISSYVAGPTASTPYWLKLQRTGATFNGYGSVDASNWLSLGSVSITMSNMAYVGLALSAHNNSLLNTASFSSVQIARPAAAVPPVLTISSVGNGAVRLTVAATIGASCVCEESTDLQHWSRISTNLNTAGTIQIQPPPHAIGMPDFYRALVLTQ